MPFKTNIALLICLAFVLRLAFVNMNLLAATSTAPTGKLHRPHSSAVSKKRQEDPSAVQTAPVKDYASVEVCEEDSDSEEDFAKASFPAALLILFSFLKHITQTLKPNLSFDFIKCDLYPKKYLALSILRI